MFEKFFGGTRNRGVVGTLKVESIEGSELKPLQAEILSKEDNSGDNAKIINQPKFFQDPDCEYKLGYVVIDGQTHPARLDKNGNVQVLKNDAEIRGDMDTYFWDGEKWKI